MPLDELMDLAAEPRADTATMPIRRPLPTTPAAPAPLNPATSRPTPAAVNPVAARPTLAPQPAVAPAPAATGPDLRERVLDDARRAYDAALEQTRLWLKHGDNGLITATVCVAALLLVVVAAL
jgi:hypothetical protein